MAIYMSKTIKEERLRWILPITNKKIKLKNMAKPRVLTISSFSFPPEADMPLV